MFSLANVKKSVFGYDIFISYSRKDSLDYAYAIAQHFMSKGYECYIDQLSSTTPGKSLPLNIKSSVKRSTSLVLIGSAGTQSSEPIAQEIDLFLKYNKNAPLIPITISSSIYQAQWYEKIRGLALIDDTEENLNRGAPAQDVLSRIENALKFTKKSAKLKSIAVLVTLGILAVSASAGSYSYLKFKEASKAINQAKVAENLKIQADNLRTVANKEKDTAIKEKDTANKMRDSANHQLSYTSSKLLSVNKILAVETIKSKTLSNKNKVQELIYNSRIEHDHVNNNLAFKYAKDAFKLESAIKGDRNATFLLVDLLNSYPSKLIDDNLMPFHYATYGTDLKEFFYGMKVFDMNPNKRQVFAWFSEPKIDQEKRIKNGFDYVEAWIKKEFQIGLIDIKGDSLVTLNKVNNKIHKHLSFYGYFFDYSLKNQKYYLVTDEDPQNKKNGNTLVLYELDNDLNISKVLPLNSSTSELLKEINSSANQSDFYYVHSFDFFENTYKINLFHIGDTCSMQSINLNANDSNAPVVYSLLKLKHGLQTYDSDYSYNKYLKNTTITDKSIFYISNDSLIEKNLATKKESLIHPFSVQTSSLQAKGFHYKYLVNNKLEAVIILDSLKYLIIKKKLNERWVEMFHYKSQDDLFNIDFDEKYNLLIISTEYKNYFLDLNSYISTNQSFTAPPGLLLGIQKFFSPTGENFHFKIDDGLLIIDNNNFWTQMRLTTVNSQVFKYSSKSKAALCLDTRSDKGGVSVTDLSNIMLDPSNILDDKKFNVDNFKDIENFPIDHIKTVSNKNIKVTCSEEGFKITKKNKLTTYYKSNNLIKEIGLFNNNADLIFYISANGVLTSQEYFNVFDVNTGYRGEYYLSHLLETPSEYQITDKYIYFTEFHYVNGKANRKIIRIVNPAISKSDLNDVLLNSVF